VSDSRSRALPPERIAELVRFAVTGAAAYLADVLVFNLLLLGADMRPTWSKVLSSVVAIAVAFAGSRWFTWRDRRSDRIAREYALFFLLSALAAGIQYLCLVVSHYALDWTSPLADNISANVVGMALATVFRFWTFRTYVFPATDGGAPDRTHAPSPGAPA
jgi:putative flippase GtrA